MNKLLWSGAGLAPAKLNLGLRVGARRPDGYHPLATVMQSLDLADHLSLLVRPADTFRQQIRLQRTSDSQNPSDVELLADPKRNLLCQAIEISLQQWAPSRSNWPQLELVWHLTKHIPTAAGLAGGSADAAAALRLWTACLHDLSDSEPGYPVLGESELNLAACASGADVPFQLLQGTAYARGIGEILRPLPAWPELPLLLQMPPFGISTARAFGALDARPRPLLPDEDLGFQEQLAITASLRQADEPELLLFALEQLGTYLVNDFEEVAIAEHPTLGQRLEYLRELAPCALMTGSGPCLAALFADEASRDQALAEVKLHWPEDRCLAGHFAGGCS